MGKHTDRGYVTAKEWSTEGGGFKSKAHLPYQRLPFNCCAIAFTPFEDPVCTDDGTVYDITNIVPYIQKHHTHPVTGQPLDLQDLVPLKFHKNSDGSYICPILGKEFTQHSHIVAVKPSGNVYSYEAVKELNANTKCWRDLITDEPFTWKDVIHIQDPMQLAKRELAAFDHVKREIDVADIVHSDEPSVIRNESATMKKVMATLQASDGNSIQEPSSRRALAMAQVEEALRKRRASQKGASSTAAAKAAAAATTASVPAAADAPADDEDDDWRMKAPAPTRSVVFKPGASTWDTDDYGEAERKEGKKAVAERKRKAREDATKQAGKVTPQQWWHENYKPQYKVSWETTGAAARSFTSTAVNVVTKNERIQKLVHRNPTKKAYLQLVTNMGTLNLELHCDVVPRTCENFLALCEMGYYENTIFHRSIRNFMIQGGDPTGTGEGGESIYGKTFPDELDSRLTHDGRGVVAMANSGKDTNGSQFFILYKSARHLDFKHTVFGKVVGGMETLTRMEAVKCSGTDRPREEIKITGCQIYVNPYRELIEEEAKAEATKKEQDDLQRKGIVPDSERHGTWFSNPRAAAQLPSNGAVTAAQRERAQNGKVGVYITPAATSTKANKKAKQSEFDAW